MKYSLFAIIFLVIGGYFYYIPSSTLDTYQATHKPDVEIVQCPSADNFTQVWNHWSKNFLAENPDAGDAGLIEGWNALMVNNGCHEWIDPLNKNTGKSSNTATSNYITNVVAP